VAVLTKITSERKNDFCQLSFLLKAKIRSDSDNCDEQYKIFKELNAVAG
jgi:hypothetical protein